MTFKKRPLPEASRELLAKKPGLVKELLDSQRVLGCSIETTKRNATDSPLLRLPGEIRNKIWEYASSGEVELHQHAGRMLFPRNHDALPAFHLPRVCRQIHGETAILAYSLSTFNFPCHIKCKACPIDEAFGKWNLQENIDAITAIEPDAEYIQDYFLIADVVKFLRTYLDCDDVCRLRDTYPSLRCIYVSKSAMKYTVEIWKWRRTAKLLGPLESENLKQWREIFEGMIKDIEGEDMKVIFKD